MTQPSPDPHMALYSKLMWPGWNPLAERQGTTDAEAERLIAEHRAAVLREAAEIYRAEAEETARAARTSYDADMARAAKQLHAVAARLNRMADGSQP
ncbi:hypothetical protein ACFWFX_28725 [Streptomyces roseolus]|uniref:hypothetical protein n=1 Tax=Streptomyces roseolus TaxID=67358 RepID=UPI003661D58D